MMYRDGRRTLFAIAVCALAAACADEPVGTDQAALISDHAHNGGTRGFYFLQPLVPPPFATGVFEPRLAPEVRIDQVHPTTGATLGTVVTFNSHTRVHGAKVRRNVRRGHYVVRWRTDDYNLSPTSTYRIRVLVEGRELGFADIDVVRTRNEFRHVDRNEYVPLKLDSTLAIKFRIETQAVDRDGDGVIDWRDNCPDVANGPGGPGYPGWPHLPPWGCDPDGAECDPDEGDCGAPPAGGQLDSDGDGVGDACECAAVTCAPADACHGAGTCQPATGACTAPALPDGDGDGVCNAIDGCPEDPHKTTPGACGCGVTDTDTDGDGTADCTDTCPLDPTKVVAGACGCGVADTDGDGDGTPD